MVQHAEARRSGARQRAENAIRTLVESGQEVNFRRVSELGHVSSAFLYREGDLAERSASCERKAKRGQLIARPSEHPTR
jgi:hypothetical protein